MLKRGTKSVVAPASKAKASAAPSSTATVAKHTPAATTAAVHSTEDKKTSNFGEHHGASNGVAKTKPAFVPAAAVKPALYISKLPLDATQEEVRGLFTKFGATAVKSVDIPAGKGFAFVDVENDAVLKAILADVSSSLYTIKGAEVMVEEKKPPRSKMTTGGSGAGGRDSRGPNIATGGGRSGAPRRPAGGGRGSGGGPRPARTGDKPTSVTV